MIRHHHEDEEAVYFPELEKHLGPNEMSTNVDQHHAFETPLSIFVNYIKDVKELKVIYQETEFLNKLSAFAGGLIPHLRDVSMLP